MNPKETQELAKLLAKMPGIRTIELKDVRKLVELLNEFPELGSIEVRGWFDAGIVINRTGNAAPSMAHHATSAPMPAQPPVSAGSSPAPVAGTAPVAAPATVLKEIKSPMVGTYYKAPEPGAEPYLKVGGRVTVGQTVCIIEAMKIMNEIEAEVSGVVKEVLADDSQPVEFGTVLFRVDPNG